MWMNEYDIEYLQGAFSEEQPNLCRAVTILANLKNWTNRNSDGWPYWQKPAKAANKLMELLHASRYSSGYGSDAEDITDAQLKAALTPIKSFLTRHGVDHAKIIR